MSHCYETYEVYGGGGAERAQPIGRLTNRHQCGCLQPRQLDASIHSPLLFDSEWLHRLGPKCSSSVKPPWRFCMFFQDSARNATCCVDPLDPSKLNARMCQKDQSPASFEIVNPGSTVHYVSDRFASEHTQCRS